ncbi:MAG: protein kinase domain-containing protein [Fimbriiglobus sp.]
MPSLTTVRRGPSDPVPNQALQELLTTPSPVETSRPRPVPMLDVPGLPMAGRAFLAELLRIGLITQDILPELFQKVGDRMGQLNSRERVGDALAGFKFLTRFVVTRAVAGQHQGLVFGGYRVLDRISSGSTGIVFRGEHILMRRPVAIKATAIDDSVSEEIIDRFFREVRILCRLDHPHIVTLHDAGKLPDAGPGQPAMAYLVMDLIPQGDLENYVYENGLPSVGTACEWARQAAMALAATHAAGFIHRDMKPSNLLLTETKTIKLIDFGLARDFASTRTSPKMLLGSLEFLAPEQLQDASTAHEPADVYGLGCTLFWLLTGQLPYPQQRSTADSIAAIKAGPPRRLRDLNRELPESLDLLMSRLLSRAPGGRPTAAQVAAELGKFAAPSMQTIAEMNGELEGLRQVVRHLESQVRTTTIQLESARSAVCEALRAATSQRPRETKEHLEKVSLTTTRLAQRLASEPDWVMFADPRAITDLGRVAAIHDLGMIGTPDEVIEIVGKRAPSDQHSYLQHPQRGDDILSELGQTHGDALPFLRLARAAVRHHHEHFDGTGFPDGLKGEKIPPAARIIAVAIAYDELRTDSNLAHTDAIAHLQQQARTLYDPAVVEALVSLEAQIAQDYDGELLPLAVAE